MIYVASPYTHPEKSVMKKRYKEVMKFTAHLLKRGLHAYSPIVHCHSMAVKFNLPRDASFWESYNFHMISLAESMAVLCAEGWEESVGIKGELKEAAKLNMSVGFHNPITYEVWRIDASSSEFEFAR